VQEPFALASYGGEGEGDRERWTTSPAPCLTARRCGLHPLGLLGKDGGKLRQMVEVALVVPSLNTQRVQEVHITVGHILCEELERRACTDALRAAAHEGSASWKPC
jgi:hypothetical protein